MEEFVDILNHGDYLQIKSLISDFNGSLIPLFKLLDKYELLHELDITVSEFYHWGKDYVLYVMENNEDLFNQWVDRTFRDVQVLDKKYYLSIADLYDFSILFCSRGQNNVQQYVKKALQGDYAVDYIIYPETNDIIELIDGLSQKNLEYLKRLFIHHLIDVELYPYTDVLQYISDKQPGDKPIQIDEKNVDLIFSDQITLEYILDNYLDSNVYSGLEDLYIQSSESNLNDQFYEEIIFKLSGFFDMDSKIMGDKNELYEIRNFKYYIKENIENNNFGEVIYANEYLLLLSSTEECLKPELPEDIDFRDMMKIANDYFTSTVH